MISQQSQAITDAKIIVFHIIRTSSGNSIVNYIKISYHNDKFFGFGGNVFDEHAV